MARKKKRIVIKLSGSSFAAERIGLLSEYAKVLIRASSVCQPIIVAGGGAIARTYIAHARASGADESTLDELGIDISRLNARLLIHPLGKYAHAHPPETLREVEHAADTGKIIVAGGLYPGQSTNGTAALIAERLRADEFINATDVDGIYDSDPNKHKNAKLLSKINITDLRTMLVREGSMAGGYDLMDIIALKVIERSKIPTRVIHSLPKTISLALAGRRTGTVINLDRALSSGSGRSKSRRTHR